MSQIDTDLINKLTTLAAPRTIDLSTKIKLPDGTEVAVGDLAQAHVQMKDLQRRMEELTQKATRAEQLEQATAVLMQDDSTPEAREKALRSVLALQGKKPDEIEAFIASAKEEDAPNPPKGGKKKVGNGGDEEDSTTGRGEDDPIQTLQQKIAEMEKARDEEKWEAINTKIKQAARDSALDPNGDVYRLLQAARKANNTIKPEDQEAVAISLVESGLRRELKRKLDADPAQKFDEKWIPVTAAEAAKRVYDSQKAVFGGVETLSRTTTVDSPLARMLQGKEPLKVPDYDPKKHAVAGLSDVATEVQDATADMLARALLEASANPDGVTQA